MGVIARSGQSQFGSVLVRTNRFYWPSVTSAAGRTTSAKACRSARGSLGSGGGRTVRRTRPRGPEGRRNLRDHPRRGTERLRAARRRARSARPTLAARCSGAPGPRAADAAGPAAAARAAGPPAAPGAPEPAQPPDAAPADSWSAVDAFAADARRRRREHLGRSVQLRLRPSVAAAGQRAGRDAA